MKNKNKKFLVFLENIKTSSNEKIIDVVKDAFTMIEGTELIVLEDEKVQDKIPGGLADDKQPTEFDSEQLAMGLMVEMEHTDDPKIALEIAMDHLAESDDYYTRLAEMEAEMKSDDEDEERDELTEAKKKKKKKKSRKWSPFKGSRMLGIGYPFIGGFSGGFSDGGDAGFGDVGGFGGDGGGGE